VHAQESVLIECCQESHRKKGSERRTGFQQGKYLQEQGWVASELGRVQEKNGSLELEPEVENQDRTCLGTMELMEFQTTTLKQTACMQEQEPKDEGCSVRLLRLADCVFLDQLVHEDFELQEPSIRSKLTCGFLHGKAFFQYQLLD
jgi:hypothetical protein